MFIPYMPFSVWFAQWYRAKRFAAGRAEGRIEGRIEGRTEGRAEGLVEGRAERRAEDIKFLKDRGFYAAAAMLEGLAQEQDASTRRSAKG